MEILPPTTVSTLTGQVTSVIADNAVVVVGVIAFGVAIAFVIRWFNKGTRRIKA